MKTETILLINSMLADPATSRLAIKMKLSAQLDNNIILRDTDDIAWESGLTDHLMENYVWVDLHNGIRVHLDMPVNKIKDER